MGSAATQSLPEGAFSSALAEKLGAAGTQVPDISAIPQPKMPDEDPLMGILANQSKQQLIAAMQAQARSDTASILARYGSQLAAANRLA